MQQVYFIDNHQLHQIKVSSFTLLTSNDVPFFRRSNDDLRFIYLLSCEMSVSCKFSHLNIILFKSFWKVSNDFWNQRFHWSNIHNLKRLQVNSVVCTPFWVNALQDCKHCDIGLTSTCRSTNKQIFGTSKCSIVQSWLDDVEVSHSFRERFMSPLWHFTQRNPSFFRLWFVTNCRHIDLIIPLLL